MKKLCSRAILKLSKNKNFVTGCALEIRVCFLWNFFDFQLKTTGSLQDKNARRTFRPIPLEKKKQQSISRAETARENFTGHGTTGDKACSTTLSTSSKIDSKNGPPALCRYTIELDHRSDRKRAPRHGAPPHLSGTMKRQIQKLNCQLSTANRLRVPDPLWISPRIRRPLVPTHNRRVPLRNIRRRLRRRSLL